MLGLILGVSSLGLLALLLISALTGRLFTKYPLFYVFIVGWLMVGLLRFFYFTFYSLYSVEYTFVYFYTQFVLVAGAYGVTWQIYAHTLKPFPGTAKMAKILVTAVFVTVLSQLFVTILVGNAEELTNGVLRLERNLHSIQAVLIVVLITLVWYYGIPLGRNLRGLLLGHGLFIATRLVTLALQATLEMSFYAWWYYSEPICVFATLLTWSVALREYQPNPMPERELELEQDYALLAHRTVQALSTARGYLARAFLQ
jgi:hypothetical protein